MKKVILKTVVIAALFQAGIMLQSCGGGEEQKEGDNGQTEQQEHMMNNDDNMHNGDMDHGDMHNDSAGTMMNDSTMSENVMYICPMHCEKDKAYDKAGKCPKCGMDLKKVEKEKAETEKEVKE